ncbi:NrfD/PsrC family molybdoenzyme membrane anchor subunit [Fimbriimonas ginsengisoli]|uniref:Polysulfide reductase NrfD n=1 Tax=Fimbriimonas ginsengisoli Gsoil 348 TaxID=661478 RepID=A0A068NS44_FIMGI|nr:NrfD/PsrC family molybdoenzyme membrane anchor subunit [Fimbriimonas ginsengisoli]AIE85550.1 polysulfide reductase NrfD [Fimbriimonas ginsengisoli Gsoil 348]
MAIREPLNDRMITGQQTYATLDESIGSLILNQKRHKRAWWIFFVVGLLGTGLLATSITWLVYKGIGIWGNNVPVGWAFDIVNFVWWIGIGHAGTLISAILLLLQQTWRNSINRFAEAMTIFAVMCAAMFPLLHTGRPWVAIYWLFPYPNIMALWPQFRSALMWDVFAVSTYFTVSLLFWYIGLIPDFATLRDKSKKKWMKVLFALLCFGWRGSNRHWHRYEQAYLILAGLSTPLVLSVHSIVSFDFAISQVPGWNVTIFPPYFVAGAVFAGFAMVLTFLIPVRKAYKLENLVTMRHIDWMAKITLATGLIVFYGYILEVFYAWYSGNPNEWDMTFNRRFTGPYSWAYFLLIFCNGILPQVLWFPKLRTNLNFLWVVCQFVGLGMWLERFVIIPMSLTAEYLPSMNKMYYPTPWDFAMFGGTIGFFIFLMFLFIRFMPVINIFEMKVLLFNLLGHKDSPNGEVVAATEASH